MGLGKPDDVHSLKRYVFMASSKGELKMEPNSGTKYFLCTRGFYDCKEKIAWALIEI